jgi:uncharacterized protein YciI
LTDFARHTLVLLRRPPGAPELSDAELDALQERHLAHLESMRKRGALAVAGPFEGQTDETLRGLCVYSVSPEDPRRLAEQDPSVHAHRLAIDVLTWLAPDGEARFGRA